MTNTTWQQREIREREALAIARCNAERARNRGETDMRPYNMAINAAQDAVERARYYALREKLGAR